MPQRVRLVLEYDGADFHGWQTQPGEATAVRTVQGELARALREVAGVDGRVVGASRTDAGVHAAGQVASLDLPDSCRIPVARLAEALNAHLADDVNVLSAAPAPPDFDARMCARGKLYCYSILCGPFRSALMRRTHWHVRWELDVPAMNAAARLLLGTHDFAAFAAEHSRQRKRRAKQEQPELSTVRQLRRLEVTAQDLTVSQPGGAPAPGAAVDRTKPSASAAASEARTTAANRVARELLVWVEGSGFLYKMVRNVVGSLVEVGRSVRRPEWVGEVLASKDRTRAGPTAPPHGLCLVWVFY